MRWRIVTLAAATVLASTPAIQAAPDSAPAAGKLFAWNMPKAAVAAQSGGPSAHQPQLDDLALWPEPDGKPAYKTQTWNASRLLVWAKPGGTADPTEPASWTENGKPASAIPDKDADVLFPASDKPYRISATHGDEVEFVMDCRHLTIEKNAAVSFFGCRITGNVWIKEGGALYMRHNGRLEGGAHTFFRNDNPVGWRPGFGPRPPKADEKTCPLPQEITQYLFVNKAKGGTVEAVGNWSTQDQFHVNSGVFIVGPDSYVGTGGRATLDVSAEGIVQLQSGAAISKRGDQMFGTDALVKGTIRGGSAERPITRDCWLGLSFKDHVGQVCSLADYPFRRSMILEDKAKLIAYSKEPAKARLVVCWHGYDWSGLYAKPLKPDDRGYKDQCRANEGIKTLPKTLDIQFNGTAEVSGVLFDDIAVGGLLMAQPQIRSAWKNVTFGPRCASRNADDLVDLLWKSDKPPVAVTVEDAGALAKIVMKSAIDGAAIRYTLDASSPTAASKVYDKPLTLDKSTCIRAAILSKSGAIVFADTVVNVPLGPLEPASAPRTEPGLRYRYYENSFDRLPDFDKLTPAGTGVAKGLEIIGGMGGPNGRGDFGTVYEGFIDVPKDGQYTFFLKVHNNARVFVGPFQVGMSDFGGRGSTEATLDLKAGKHPFRVLYWHQKWKPELSVSWKGPGIDKQEIPTAAMSHTQ